MTPTANIPTSQPAPRAPQYRLLDAWRGIACLLIVGFHATATYRQLAGPGETAFARIVYELADVLWLGVPIFFVISGYCIAATLDATRRRNHYLRNYLVRRFRRIYPPYLASLAFLVIGFLAIEWLGLAASLVTARDSWFSLTGLSWIDWVGNLTLTEYWLPQPDGGPARMISRVAWSLCYEQQFYLLCFAFLALAPRRFFVATAFFSATMVALLAAGHGGPWFGHLRGTFLDGRWLEFACGLGLYWRLNYPPRRGAVAFEGLLLLGVAGIVGLVIARPGMRWIYEGSVLFELAFCGVCTLILVVMRPLDGRLAAVRALAPLQWCGTICYSLYLIHWPFCKVLCSLAWVLGIRSLWGTLLVTVPVCFAVSLLAGWIFYNLVERRYLNTKVVPTRAAAPTLPEAGAPMMRGLVVVEVPAGR